MNFIRQLDIFDVNEFQLKEIAIVGVGSVGSFTCLALTKMGLQNFVLWDFDSIEEHNLPNQFFMESQLNQKKDVSTQELITKFSPSVNVRLNGKVKKDSLIFSDVTILCTDSMASRKLAYEKCKDFSRFLIDARMGGQVMIIYTIDLKDPKQRKEYEKTLYPDEESEDLLCTEKAIIYNVLGISSMICNQLKKVLSKEKYNFEVVFDYQNLIFLKK